MDFHQHLATTPPFCFCRHFPPCYTQPNTVPCYATTGDAGTPATSAYCNHPECFCAAYTHVQPTASHTTDTTDAFPSTVPYYCSRWTFVPPPSPFPHFPQYQPHIEGSPAFSTLRRKYRYHPMNATTDRSRCSSTGTITTDEENRLTMLMEKADRFIPPPPVPQKINSVFWRIKKSPKAVPSENPTDTPPTSHRPLSAKFKHTAKKDKQMLQKKKY